MEFNYSISATKFIYTWVLVLWSFILTGQYVEVEEIIHTCGGSSYGSIALKLIEGDESDYYFVWQHSGETSLSTQNLSAGTYSFYIEDQYGCSEIIEYKIVDITSCRSDVKMSYDSRKCTFGISVTLYDQDGNFIPEEQYTITWDPLAFSGSHIEVPSWIPNNSVCYKIEMFNSQGDVCCSQSQCIDLVLPAGEKPCLPEPTGCKVIINEFGKLDNNNQFVELLVIDDKDCSSKGKCDIRNTIIDDNNGADRFYQRT